MNSDVFVRFWSKVAVGAPNDCWEWTRSRNRTGYGQFRIESAPASQYKAHRIAWELANGRQVPAGLMVCHRCDNPPCCNPKHLFPGTAKDNMQDCAQKGRMPALDPVFIDALVERQRVLTDEQIEEALRCCAGGESRRSIARRFGVAHTTISRLVNGEQWSSWTTEKQLEFAFALE